jgi:hypothetical protein
MRHLPHTTEQALNEATETPLPGGPPLPGCHGESVRYLRSARLLYFGIAFAAEGKDTPLHAAFVDGSARLTGVPVSFEVSRAQGIANENVDPGPSFGVAQRRP